MAGGSPPSELLHFASRALIDGAIMIRFEDFAVPAPVFVAFSIEGETVMYCWVRENVTALGRVTEGEQAELLDILFHERPDQEMTRGFWSHSVRRNWECHELCVSGLAHAGFR